ncbi:hypothetical protein SDC9_114179 [bioreactor metagenome]|uniref:Uncharacterized protein n=1 Tax=bioreactor metagenome TaxID=1076179 RepID=A0A645BPS5_9ZZZZ
MPGTVIEVGDGQLAVVLAELAGALRTGDGETVQVAFHHRRDRARLVMHPGGQRRTVGTHQTRNVGTHDLDTGLQFERPQHRIVQERAALGHHLVTELGAVTHLHHLVQGVADHRVAQSGGDIADRGALLLSLLDRGIHEDGAAAAQVDRRR